MVVGVAGSVEVVERTRLGSRVARGFWVDFQELYTRVVRKRVATVIYMYFSMRWFRLDCVVTSTCMMLVEESSEVLGAC